MAAISRYLIGVLCCCVLLTACSESDDAAAIKTLVESGAELAEQKSISDMMKLTTEDFVAVPGQQDRRVVKRILFAAFAHYRNFTIHYPSFKIEIADDGISAVVALPFAIVRKEHELPGLEGVYNDPQEWVEAAGEKADLYHLTMLLRKQDGEWLVAQAELRSYHRSRFPAK